MIELLRCRVAVKSGATRLMPSVSSARSRRIPITPNVEAAESHYLSGPRFGQPPRHAPSRRPCHLGLGKLYRRTGKREQAQEHLTTATTMYRQMGMTYCSN